MKLIYGTHNPSKIKHMQMLLEGLDIEIVSLASLSRELTEADETGNEPLHNARDKAVAYYEQLRQPVFSCDSGLYFDEVEAEDQPGVHIRRIHGMNLRDHEFIDYYSNLAAKYGGRLTAHYQNAICLIMGDGEIYEYDGEELSSERFWLVEQPHTEYMPGFPLNTLSVDIQTGEYYYDLQGARDKNIAVNSGFRNFFGKVLAAYAGRED